jgi:hypothetical protein
VRRSAGHGPPTGACAPLAQIRAGAAPRAGLWLGPSCGLGTELVQTGRRSSGRHRPLGIRPLHPGHHPLGTATPPRPAPPARPGPGPPRPFLRDGVRAPLALGDVLLEDGSQEKGFVGEGYGVVGAPDISGHGGWRGFLAAQQAGGA